LYGYTHGQEPAACGRLGALAASEVISHLGARPERSLAELAASLASVKLPRYRTGDATLDNMVAALVERTADERDADLISS